MSALDVIDMASRARESRAALVDRLAQRRRVRDALDLDLRPADVAALVRAEPCFPQLLSDVIERLSVERTRELAADLAAMIERPTTSAFLEVCVQLTTLFERHYRAELLPEVRARRYELEDDEIDRENARILATEELP